MKPYMNQTSDVVIDGRDYFGRIQVTLAGLEGSIFRYYEDWEYGYQEDSYTNGWLTSIAVYREGNTIHKWISGSGGLILYTNDYITDVLEDNTAQISEFKLNQNYPNPFNPSTTISWQAPIAGHQTLKVYDVLGNEVAALVDEYRAAGNYETEFNPTSSIKNLASGIYFYQLKAGDYVETKKMILLK
jgi:hypothetical protein